MKIKSIIIGSTGMIGQGLLRECLECSDIESVLVLNRQPLKIAHPKLKEIIHNDFFNLSPVAGELSGYDACFFCLGVTSAGLSEKEYSRITYELTLYIAEILLNANKGLTFCYISGAGTDSTEKGRIMWARVKGRTENALLAMPFRKAYMFRPGYIQPLKGIKSKTRLYNMLYAVLKPFYFILKHFKGMVTNTEMLGKAMISVTVLGYDKNILECRDINKMTDFNGRNK